MIRVKNNNDVVVCEGDKNTIVNFLLNNGHKNISIDTPIMVIGYLFREQYSLYLV